MSLSMIPNESAYVMKGVQLLRQSRTSVKDQSEIWLKSKILKIIRTHLTHQGNHGSRYRGQPLMLRN
ncbi:hypothetical protein M8C21_004577 [Ambrosia artemisiifolia]|uniref:Uncharacterized protein n=1 Tax=Ambrosia artemisiifolia TaxID=4212 RepID=A0AAD5BK49_AMBAR|nr:hypothetical protein M8C21_004577 [Ambrosia artemisiifolia]